MNLSSVQKGLKNLGGVISRNSPHILTGLGCAGVLTTAILTGHAVLRAHELLETEGTCRHHEHNFDPLDPLEEVKMVWRFFIPPAVMGLTSIACIIGANTINANRNAALAALYSLSETAFREYKERVVEEIGRNKELRIRDNVAQERVANNPPGDRTIIVTGYGDHLCYDVPGDRYFESSAEKIRQQVLELNYTLMNDTWVSLNDLYYALGLKPTPLGDKMGFYIDRGRIEIDYSSQLTPEGRPCLVMDYEVYPKYMR